MEATIVEFEIQPNRKRLAWVLIKYGEVYMNCDLVYFKKENKLWIRMPEIWITKEKKFHSVYWPNRKTSDEFQKIILDQILTKYNFDLEKTLELSHKNKVIAKNKSKNLECKRKP